MRGLSLGSLQLHCWSTGGVITVDVTTHLGMGFLVVYSVELFQMRLLQISVFVCLFLKLGFVGGRMCVRVILLNVAEVPSPAVVCGLVPSGMHITVLRQEQAANALGGGVR